MDSSYIGRRRQHRGHGSCVAQNLLYPRSPPAWEWAGAYCDPNLLFDHTHKRIYRHQIVLAIRMRAITCLKSLRWFRGAIKSASGGIAPWVCYPLLCQHHCRGRRPSSRDKQQREALFSKVGNANALATRMEAAVFLSSRLSHARDAIPCARLDRCRSSACCMLSLIEGKPHCPRWLGTAAETRIIELLAICR